MNPQDSNAEAKATLLVVDDIPEIRDVLRRRFAKRGYVVVEAAGGPEALETVEQKDIDLVILDVSMPGMSGMEVLEKLRASPRGKELPIIMATGHVQAVFADEAMRLGATGYVEKPIDFRSLLALVVDTLAG